MGHCRAGGQLRYFSGRVEESGPDSGGWGPAEEPLFTVETALEQAHFSTVFVALLGGWGGVGVVQGFLRAGQLTKAAWSPAPCRPPAGNTCFHFTGPARQCVQAGLHGDSGCHSSSSFSHRYPSYFTLRAAEHPGALCRPQPRLANFQPSGTVLGPGWQQCQWTTAHL